MLTKLTLPCLLTRVFPFNIIEWFLTAWCCWQCWYYCTTHSSWSYTWRCWQCKTHTLHCNCSCGSGYSYCNYQLQLCTCSWILEGVCIDNEYVFIIYVVYVLNMNFLCQWKLSMYIITSSCSLQGSDQDTTSDNPPHSIPAEGPATIEDNIAVVLNTLFS